MSKRRALLVGINYPGTSSELRGCVNDVMAIREVLQKYYGFTDPKEVRMLTDGAATTEGILERLEWLVAGAEKGDVLYFHYSGHGSQMVQDKYAEDKEPDKLDEIICPIDLDWRDKLIKDDDLKRIFDKVPSGVSLTVMLDCCHSGSGLDQAYQYQPLGLGVNRVMSNEFGDDSPNRNRGITMPPDIENRAVGLDLRPNNRSVQSRDVNKTGLLVSACQSQQTSADAWIGNTWMGAATFCLIEALKAHDYDISHKELVEHMNQNMVDRRYSQRPELNGALALFNQKFLEPVSDGMEPNVEPVLTPEEAEEHPNIVYTAPPKKKNWFEKLIARLKRWFEEVF